MRLVAQTTDQGSFQNQKIIIRRPNVSLLFHRQKNQDMSLSDSHKIIPQMVGKLNPRCPALTPLPTTPNASFLCHLICCLFFFLPMCTIFIFYQGFMYCCRLLKFWIIWWDINSIIYITANLRKQSWRMMYSNWGLSGKQHKELATFLVKFWILF